MSDQETKPAEGVTAPVENPDANNNESATAPDAMNVDNQEIADDKAADAKDTSGNTEDAAKEDKTPDVTEAQEDKVETKQETQPSTTSAKPMLKVNRNGCPTREKSDPSILPDSDDAKLIRRQVQFYFSDSNLPQDKFLWEKTGGSENKPVPISLICSFSRMRRFKPYSAVVNALKDSEVLVVEGSEGEETVRRKGAFQEDPDREKKIHERSTYIKGFGEEKKSTQFDVEDFLSKYGEFNTVRLRRSEDSEKVFKGSVFVEWIDKETADAFLALDPKPLWLGEYEMSIIPKTEYVIQQAKEEARKGKGHGHSQRGQRGGRGSHQSRGNHRNTDVNDWKKRRQEDHRNGFDDRRGRRDHRGRGRGRGGRGRGNDRGQNGNGRADEQQRTARDNGRPKIHASKESIKDMKEEAKRNSEAQANGKRARDDDGTTDAPPTKKVDTKEAAANAA
ncbi:uncharacterized protein F4822DRAFT_416970 [Hypoxylon trugodes]|uniref:uncharacterized protein n=1 Tax=Hypoxylon trugodes TaxID=326681 RepID=UPI00218FB423|nr:uncharacterized protein F4822DRAFT_416970 [Hypoxylon trugodes]KAI1384999.1 hypothetical protein F4822DRAFT_416970 [Hypoxylon trugodes]